MICDVPNPRSAAAAQIVHQSLYGGYRSIVCQPDCFSTTGALDRPPQAQCSVADHKLPSAAWAASRSTDIVELVGHICNICDEGLNWNAPSVAEPTGLKGQNERS